MRNVLFAVMLAAAVPASAQVQSRPADPPQVTAESAEWYRLRQPVPFAGTEYYPAGAAIFFNANSMVRTGDYNGVPLYADTTIEPYSIVYVPIGRGLLQPYERVRQGELAGTTGSRTPAFPVRATDEAARLPVAPSSPSAAPRPLAAVDAAASETGAVGTSGRVVSTPAVSGARPSRAPRPSAQRPVATGLRPESNDGIWLQFMDETWVSAGPAVPLNPSLFVQVGEYAGFPVYARRGLDEDMLYLATPAGPIAPYRLKE